MKSAELLRADQLAPKRIRLAERSAGHRTIEQGGTASSAVLAEGQLQRTIMPDYWWNWQSMSVLVNCLPTYQSIADWVTHWEASLEKRDLICRHPHPTERCMARLVRAYNADRSSFSRLPINKLSFDFTTDFWFVNFFLLSQVSAWVQGIGLPDSGEVALND